MKKKYRITALYGASKCLGTVEADSKEEAADLGEELDIHVSLCHQCAREIDIGDCSEIIAECEEEQAW